MYTSIKHFFHKKPFFAYLTSFTVSFLICTYIQATPTLPDPDSFYHIRLAKMMAEQGIIQEFPWLQFTRLKDGFTDHHLLYHWLLLPFVKYFDDFSGAKFLTIVLASILVTTFYWLLKKFKAKYPLILTLLLLTSTGFVFRINLVKAQALVLTLFFLMLYAILNRKLVFLFLLSFIYVWAYGGWIMALIAAGLYILAGALTSALDSNVGIGRSDFLRRNRVLWFIKFIIYYLLFIIRRCFSRKNILLLLVVVCGLTLGLISNPYFPKNLYFYFVQVFKIGFINNKSDVAIGIEWYSPDFMDFLLSNILIMVLWLVSSAWYVYTFKFQKQKAHFFFILSFLFFILALRSARNIEYFAPLAILSSIFIFKNNPFKYFKIGFGEFWFKIKNFLRFSNPLVATIVSGYIVASLFVLGLVVVSRVFSLREVFAEKFSYDTFYQASEWLKKNTPRGALVFHSSWDEFPLLFYHNQHNYYLVGLDATFMYDYDKELYGWWRRITDGKDKEAVARKISYLFKAQYIFVDKEGHDELVKTLKRDKSAVMRYEDEEAVVFEVTE